MSSSSRSAWTEVAKKRMAGIESRNATVKHKKYRNIPTMVDGITFSSRKEAAHYKQLKFLQMAGKITELCLQTPFSIIVNDVHVCDYISDFTYRKDDKMVVVDTKGMRTKEYVLKKKLLKAAWDLDITEV